MLNEHLIAKTRPIANEKNVIYWKDYRVTVLQDGLFRMEKSKVKQFRDEATQVVWFRDMPAQKFTCLIGETQLQIKTSRATLVVKERRGDCFVELGDKKISISNKRNLKGTYRTLDGCDGKKFVYWDMGHNEKVVKLGNGVCSKTGVAVIRDENSLTLGADGEIKPERGKGTDEYIFVYGDDYRSAVKALYLITGNTPLIPRFALGNWWSRYHAYTQEEYLRLLTRFEEREVPLTVATIDMDWHWSKDVDKQKGITEKGRNLPEYVQGRNGTTWISIGWTGYSWNTELFPDYKEMLADIQSKNLKITLNLHPSDGVRFWEDQYVEMAKAMDVDYTTDKPVYFDITNAKFINAYFNILHKPYEKDGVNFWWIDWQQGNATGIDGLDPLWSLNHYHYLDNAVNHFTPLILSRYAGVGSHRYPLGFSGDTSMTWDTLKYLPEFTATATNIGYTWWSHDIGGHHLGEKDNEMYVRHVQYGVFSPINRLHCTCWQTMSKEPWYYENGTGLIVTEWLRLRHKLIPFLYSSSHRTHRDGVALVEPLYYEWKQTEAYERKKEYLFGGELLVVPVTTKLKKDGYARVNAWLPEGEWIDIFTGDRYNIPVGGQNRLLLRTLNDIPVLIKAGGILPLSRDKGNSVENPEKLEICVWSGNGEYVLYEDGRTQENTAELYTRFYATKTERNGNALQILRIVADGDGNVIPKNRSLRISFKDIPQGEVFVYKNGEKLDCKKLFTDFVAVEFPFDYAGEYEVKVNFEACDGMERLKNRARDVLLRAEGDNRARELLFGAILKAQNENEYLQTIENSTLSNGLKLRLKETL